MCDDELDCITNAVGMYRTILDEADDLAGDGVFDLGVDPEAEVRQNMPRLLAGLSPQARALLADHLGHLAELVAFTHRVTSRADKLETLVADDS